MMGNPHERMQDEINAYWREVALIREDERAEAQLDSDSFFLGDPDEVVTFDLNPKANKEGE